MRQARLFVRDHSRKLSPSRALYLSTCMVTLNSHARALLFSRLCICMHTRERRGDKCGKARLLVAARSVNSPTCFEFENNFSLPIQFFRKNKILAQPNTDIYLLAEKLMKAMALYFFCGRALLNGTDAHALKVLQRGKNTRE